MFKGEKMEKYCISTNKQIQNTSTLGSETDFIFLLFQI